MNRGFELVQLKNGAFSIKSLAHGETFHPVEGPVREAEELYVRQLKLRERAMCREDFAGTETRKPAGGRFERFVIWDVGLGAGGNALTTLACLRDLPAHLHIISFDRTTDGLQFALQHAAELAFTAGLEKQIRILLEQGKVEFQHEHLNTRWETCLGDFPSLLVGNHQCPAPHAIFFDAFSPARNPEMWTLPLFENLFRRLEPTQPCSLATFSRSTMARVAMLLAGFYVGVGETIAGKEETTVAANAAELIKRPLDVTWLERARISKGAEPLFEPRYRQAPLSTGAWERLLIHPQFTSRAG